MFKIFFVSFLLLLFSAANSCDDIKSVGSKGGGFKADSASETSESNGDQRCGTIALPPIKAQVGYIHIPAGWLGGMVGINYALSAPASGGSSGNIQVEDNIPSDMGCDNSGSYSEDEILEAANDIMDGIEGGIETYLSFPPDDAWEITLHVLGAGFLGMIRTPGEVITIDFPNGSEGDFVVGSDGNLSTMSSCRSGGG